MNAVALQGLARGGTGALGLLHLTPLLEGVRSGPRTVGGEPRALGYGALSTQRIGFAAVFAVTAKGWAVAL